MKNSQSLISRWTLCLIAIQLIQFGYVSETVGQYPGINNDIARLRKGELIIKANPGDKVVVEQLSHEFWFGCAISNGIAGDRMSAEDKSNIRKNFLKISIQQ